MIIYPFDPKELDDKALDKQIKAIAHVLCNVHFKIAFNKKSPDGLDTLDFLSSLVKDIPLKQKIESQKNDLRYDFPYSNWASECRGNYLKLVDMGWKASDEYSKRFSCENCYFKHAPCFVMYDIRSGRGHQTIDFKIHKMLKVIEWTRRNRPKWL